MNEMRFRRGNIILTTFLLFLTLTACGSATATPTQTSLPSSTPALPSTPTRTPVPTVSPTPEIASLQVCDPDAFVVQARNRLAYGQFVVTHLRLQGNRVLNLWFVDPELDPGASAEEMVDNVDLAFLHGVEAVYTLRRLDACVEALFDKISTIVVDRDYNGWFSAEFTVADLPPATDLSFEEAIEHATAGMSLGYLREVLPPAISSQPPPEGSLDWQETRRKIFQHFSSQRPNVDFYLVIDEGGVNLWAQWDSIADMIETEFASILNVSMEASLLHPPVDSLWVVVVDEEGEINFIGRVPGEAVRSEDLSEAINQFELLYQ
ncbi:MAG: hypothetical protein GTO14_16465 [Anaerolineales bacterium]|nr:hypothetical protein [Anaerolineales bacterium]